MGHRMLPVRALAGAALALATATACGGAAAQPGPTAPGPAISKAKADEVQAAYDAGNNQINKTFNVAGVNSIEAPPLKTASQAWIKIKKALKQPIPPIIHTDGTYLIPSETAFPRWFVSVTRSSRGGVPSPRPAYTVFVQWQASAPWLAAYLASPSEPVPPVETNAAGAVAVVTKPDGLLVAPAALGAAIYRHYTTGATRDEFARTIALDDQLGAGYRVGKEMYAARGWEWVRTLHRAAQPSYALRTKDGGALVFSSSAVIDVVRPGNESQLVKLDAGSNEAALVGRPTGVTSEKLTVGRLQMFLTHIPTKASGQKVRVLAYTDTPVAVA